MIVYPDQKTAQKRSKEHIQPIITESPPLAKHLTGNQDDFQILIYHLDRMTANLVWSGSPSALAAEPVRYLFRDEFAKFQGATDKEADAMSLSARRTTSYDWMARILDCTTPTTTYATGWTDLITGTYNRYWAPCPHCNEFQVLVFSQFDFPSKGQDEDYADYLVRIKKETFYKSSELVCSVEKIL
jgi:phage terminase large subunit GpA-like protein